MVLRREWGNNNSLHNPFPHSLGFKVSALHPETPTFEAGSPELEEVHRRVAGFRLLGFARVARCPTGALIILVESLQIAT